MNKFDTFVWVKKVIISCKTFKQSENCQRLIENFYSMYDDIDLYSELVYFSIMESDNLTI